MKNKIINYKDILKKLTEVKDTLSEQGVRKIGLFGSFVKGKQNKKSDIDILVKFDDYTFDNYAELLLLLEKIFKRKIDLVFEKSLKPEFLYVKKEAKYVRL